MTDSQKTEHYRAEVLPPGQATKDPQPGVLYVESDVSAPGVPDRCVFLCPCGGGERCHLNLMPGMRPLWTLALNGDKPTLKPSVNTVDGCRSHFRLIDGVVHWC